jgi:zinc transporter
MSKGHQKQTGKYLLSIQACLIDGAGAGKKITLAQAKRAVRKKQLVWVHSDYRNVHNKRFIKSLLGDHHQHLILNTLFAEESRPRAVTLPEGLLLTLRNINFNKGAKPEDMISTRFWLTESLILSTNHREVLVIKNLQEMLKKGEGPASTSEFLKQMVNQMTESITDVVCDLDDNLDYMEEKFNHCEVCPKSTREEISELRRRIIMIKRYLLPQREAFILLQTEQLVWITTSDTIHLREIADSTIRSLEDLDASKDRALVLYEECISQIQEQLNSKIYLLSVVAIIFMPLTFITGLLGINVAGIPGASSHYAFGVVCGILLCIGCLQLIYFRIRRWI